MFALDGSDSLTTEQFSKLKEFVKNTTDKYPVSLHGTHIGVIEYSSAVPNFIPLNATYDLDEFIITLQGLQPSRGKRVDTEKLLKVASVVFGVKHGGRPEASKVLVILTDDKPTARSPLAEITETLRETGVRVYVVAIGEKVNPDDYTGLVSDKSTIYPTNTTDEVPGLVTPMNVDITKAVTKREFFNPYFL